MCVDQLDLLWDVGHRHGVHPRPYEEEVKSSWYPAFIETELENEPDGDHGAVEPDTVEPQHGHDQ